MRHPAGTLLLLGAACSPHRLRGTCAALLGDPWVVLGVPSDASAAQVRRAFRERARKLHPDVCDDSNAEELFCDLVSALELVQEGLVAAGSRAPKYDSPGGLSTVERVAWLVAQNKVVCFIRGTKHEPLCRASDFIVQALSGAAFDTNTRFAAVDVAADQELGAAVLRHSHRATLPLCYIDGECIDVVELQQLDESGELTRRFGGEQLVEPKELDWRTRSWATAHREGARTPLTPEEFEATYERDGTGALRPRRSRRCCISGQLEWMTYFEEDDIWMSEFKLQMLREHLGGDFYATTPQQLARDREHMRQQQEDQEEQQEPEELEEPAEPAEPSEPVEAQQQQPGQPATEEVMAIAAVEAYRWSKGRHQWQVRWLAGAAADEEELESSWEYWHVLEVYGTDALRARADELRAQPQAVAGNIA